MAMPLPVFIKSFLSIVLRNAGSGALLSYRLPLNNSIILSGMQCVFQFFCRFPIKISLCSHFRNQQSRHSVNGGTAGFLKKRTPMKTRFPACVAAATTPTLSAKEPKQTQWDVQTWNSAQRSFFLYEKSGLGESDSLRGRKPEVCTDLTPPLSALNLSKLQVPRGFNPLGRGLGTASPRSCPSTTQKFQTGV